MTLRIGINGFGRIGRCIFRIARRRPDVRVVAVNDLGDIKTLAHLLKYDSAHGNLRGQLRVDGDRIWVDDEETVFFSKSAPEELSWGEYGVDVVVESTGRFRSVQEAGRHLAGGASRVVVTAPLKGPGRTIVMGVNEQDYDPATDLVVSGASCTTNCLAPIAKVLGAHFKVRSSMVSTIHAYTSRGCLSGCPLRWSRFWTPFFRWRSRSRPKRSTPSCAMPPKRRPCRGFWITSRIRWSLATSSETPTPPSWTGC